MSLKRICHRHNTPEERFRASYMKDTESDCWLWQGAPRDGGYGRISVNGKAIVAHRYSYELHNGPIPEGAFILHKCDTPACVNPAHLWAGTHAENMADAKRKGRNARGPRLSAAQGNQARCGERSESSKLTEKDVIRILADKRPQRKIANDFGITQSCVHLIKARKTWRHIDG